MFRSSVLLAASAARASTYRPRGFWKILANQRSFLDDIIHKEGINENTIHDLLTPALVNKNGGYPLVKQYPSFSHALKTSRNLLFGNG